MDDEEMAIFLDVDQAYNFGDDENDTPAVFSQTTTWQQIVEMKSAAHEGYLTYHILTERSLAGLPLYAKSLFSVHSPLEKIHQYSPLFEGTINNTATYLENIANAIDNLEQIALIAPQGSGMTEKLVEIIELLCMQLYGFGRAALQEEVLIDALEAFRIAGLLHKEKVGNLLRDYIGDHPTTEEQVKEYIHFHT